MLSKFRSLSAVPALLIAPIAAFLFMGNAGPARAACNPDPPMNDDAVVCDGMDSIGYDGSGATGLTITTNGVTLLDESGGLDSAILVSDDNTITIDVDATINVTEVDGFGIRSGDNNTIDNLGAINLGVDDGTGIRTNNDGRISNQGTITITGNGGIAIGVNDNNAVNNQATITITGNNGVGIQGNDLNTLISEVLITIDGDDGVGIQGNNNNFADNRGTIEINGLDGRGILLNQNTNGILPNGAVNRGVIDVNADRGFAIETGDNAGVTTSGNINLNANETRGISAGNRTNPLFAANLSNTGVIVVAGDDSFGIKAGDGWADGTFAGNSGAAAPGVFMLSLTTITVSGSDSVGIFVGDETNLVGNHNSFVSNGGFINASGFDAIAVSLGGQDLLDPFDSQDTSSIPITSFTNTGTILGGVDAKPLIVFRDFVAGRENSFGNGLGARISANTTNRGMPDRAIAIMGTAGDEFIFNLGEIEGDVELGDGNNTYVHGPTSTLTDSTITAGTGIDLLTLLDNSSSDQSFDLDLLDNFDRIEVGGGTFGWELLNTNNFMGNIEIAPMGRLRVPTPIMVNGDFLAAADGTLDLTVDVGPPAITVTGAATFDGDLIVRLEPTVSPGPTLIRAISVAGGTIGQFDLLPSTGNQILAVTYDAMGLLVQLVSASALGVATGSTQRAIARHLDDIKAIGATTPALQTLLDEFDTATGNLNNIFGALSPEVYDAHTTTIVEGGRRVTNLLFDRPRECEVGKRNLWQGPDVQLPCHTRTWSPWLASVAGSRTREDFGGNRRYDTQLAGLVFGVDFRPIESLGLTLAISSQRGTIDGASDGKSTVTLTDISGHAAWDRGPLRAQGALSWSHGFHDDRRRIRFAEAGITTVDRRGLAEHDSNRIGIAGEVGYVFEVGPVEIEPIGGLDWTWVYQRPIHESETFGLGIRIDSRDDSIGSINAGVRVSASYLHSKYLAQQLLWMDGVWTGSLDVRWRQMLTGFEREFDARLQGAPDGVSDFTIKGQEDAGGAELGAAIRFAPKNANRLQFDLRYEAFVAKHTIAHDLTAQARVSF